jgi:hypothetical protein
MDDPHSYRREPHLLLLCQISGKESEQVSGERSGERFREKTEKRPGEEELREREMGMEECFEKSLLLIVLLEEFLRESTLLGCQIEKFTVVALATEGFCQLLCDNMATASYLATYVYDDFSHNSLFYS